MKVKNIKKTNKKLEMKMQKNKIFLMRVIQRCAFLCSPVFFAAFSNLFLDSMTKRDFKNINEVGMWFLLTSSVVVSTVFTTELLEENENINQVTQTPKKVLKKRKPSNSIQKQMLKRHKAQLNIYKILRALSFSIYTLFPAISAQKIFEYLTNAQGEDLSKAVSFGLVTIASFASTIKCNNLVYSEYKENFEQEKEMHHEEDLDIIDLDTEEGELRLSR